MKMIGITGKTGTGKTLLAKEFESKDIIVIDVDKIIKNVSYNGTIMQQTTNYLYEKYRDKLKHSQNLVELLMYSRKNIKQLEDPLWKEAERQIDLIINYSNVQKIIFDYALLPKTKYFNMCDYNILLLPTNDELRKKAVIKRDNLENTEILDRRDKYSIDYRNYKFNKICINSYRENQFSVLKASILEELKNVNLGNINYTEIRE